MMRQIDKQNCRGCHWCMRPALTLPSPNAATFACAQEYKERTERIKELREEFTTASTDLQTLTTAVEEKKVRCTICLRLMEDSKLSPIQQIDSPGNMER